MPSGIPESHVTISLKCDASCIRIFFRFICEKGTRVKSKKECAILKRAMTERHTGRSRRVWNSKPKNHWRSSPVEGAGQSSRDRWKSSKPQGKLKEVSLEMDALGSALKEKTHTHTWNISCKESATRETQQNKMTEIATKDEKQEDTERTSSRKHLNNFVKRRKKQMRPVPCWTTRSKKVDEADAEVTETRRRLYREINEYMHSWDQELGRPHCMDKVWQMMQSNDTVEDVESD